MTYYYSLTRTLDEDEPYSTTTSVSDRDPVNCAHMLAAVFNTMNGFIMPGWVLGVVDTKAGTVQYQGKVEKFDRPEPAAADTWPGNMHFSKTFNFEASTDADTLITIFDNENGRLMFPGKFKLPEESKYAHVNRDVLESAYGELEDVKSVLADARVETIPAASGVSVLRDIIRDRDETIAEFVQESVNRATEQAKYESGEYMPLRWESLAKIDEALRDNDVTNKRLDEGVRELGRRLEHEFHARTAMEEQYGQANESARAELIAYVKSFYAPRMQQSRYNPEFDVRLQGMLDVLAKFLVVTGEADASEGHAVARRLCGIYDE